jgi:D-methionine transport system permease protein
MVGASTFLAVLIGLPLGIVLTLTDKGHLQERPFLHRLLDVAVNIGRSFPFAILIIALIPFTRLLVGTSLGTTATIIPLTVATIPFIARLVDSSLKEVDRQILEAAVVMGSTTSQIVGKVLLPEALPALISALTLTVVNVIGYSTMAGLVGGGGLGQVAVQYGYNRFNGFIMGTTVLLLIFLVQLVQWGGSRLVRRILRKRGNGGAL